MATEALIALPTSQ